MSDTPLHRNLLGAPTEGKLRGAGAESHWHGLHRADEIASFVAFLLNNESAFDPRRRPRHSTAAPPLRDRLRSAIVDHGLMAYIGLVTLVVRDYDEAIDFYVRAAGFQLVEDTRLSEQKRWVVVAPPGTRESGLLLAQAASAGQRERIGDQTGGRVCLFLNTAEFNRDYQRLRAAGSGSPSRLVRRPTAPSPFSKTSTAIAGIRSSQPDIAQMPSDPARLALAGESHCDGQATAETSSRRDKPNTCAIASLEVNHRDL